MLTDVTCKLLVMPEHTLSCSWSATLQICPEASEGRRFSSAVAESRELSDCPLSWVETKRSCNRAADLVG